MSLSHEAERAVRAGMKVMLDKLKEFDELGPKWKEIRVSIQNIVDQAFTHGKTVGVAESTDAVNFYQQVQEIAGSYGGCLIRMDHEGAGPLMYAVPPGWSNTYIHAYPLTSDEALARQRQLLISIESFLHPHRQKLDLEYDTNRAALLREVVAELNRK